MDIAYDASKNVANILKHGIAPGDATNFEWDEALTWRDDRRDYGEVRLCSLGYTGQRLHYVVYVLRDDICRIISLRRANSREVKRYAKT